MSVGEKVFLENKIQIPWRRSVSNGSVCLEKYNRSRITIVAEKKLWPNFLTLREGNIKIVILSQLYRPNFVIDFLDKFISSRKRITHIIWYIIFELMNIVEVTIEMMNELSLYNE